MDWAGIGIFAAGVVFSAGALVGKVYGNKYVSKDTFDEWRIGFERRMNERHTAVMYQLRELTEEVKKWR